MKNIYFRPNLKLSVFCLFTASFILGTLTATWYELEIRFTTNIVNRHCRYYFDIRKINNPKFKECEQEVFDFLNRETNN